MATKTPLKNPKPTKHSSIDFLSPRRSSRLASPITPNPKTLSPSKRKIDNLSVDTPDNRDAKSSTKTNPEKRRDPNRINKNSNKRAFYKRVSYDGAEFAVGDDVYVKRREKESDDEGEVEECRVCFRAGKGVMIECDNCLGGFHLKCLKPPLKAVPDGDWVCGICVGEREGREVEFLVPPEGRRRARTLREKLLSSDLWAACIERWK